MNCILFHIALANRKFNVKIFKAWFKEHNNKVEVT